MKSPAERVDLSFRSRNNAQFVLNAMAPAEWTIDRRR